MTTAPYQQYTSPIPVRRAHLGDALASEWTKIRSVRSTMWTLGVMILLMVGVGLLAIVAINATDAPMGNDPVLSLGFNGVLLGSICVVTLGVLTISSEYGTGMIRTTLTACPSRARVLTAKAIVFFLLTLVVTTITAALVAALQTAMIDGGVEATGEQWLRATVGAGLFTAVLGLVALAVGALVRHSAGAITIMIGVMLLPLVAAMFMSSMVKVQEFLFQYSIPSLLIAFYSEEGLIDGGPHGWTPLWILSGVAAVALAGAFFATEKRDV
ncbi:ABC transporter permease [Streptomyces sp. WAC05374]|uniref:ABC transporter permease n=1 Tax=Streptomyces sp. WAC05374 TaxID=2487420 RepID=UPI000F8639C6|nr:ABC transporter permease [Streptomyces sp. WAC05374]RST19171.1 ABC transporter permease [Streptomyces sp. WAC05374]TDF38060.1 ABC transporter permease [Streptomyces sp. WAC05374]TDF53519.1 ABC transporter permease [Streptomyces sp. WAC05374]TDF59366.1 ABC transporter permease [Streptomyces sp. WAC05374]